jgi:hypothetical protein
MQMLDLGGSDNALAYYSVELIPAIKRIIVQPGANTIKHFTAEIYGFS